MSSSSAVYLLNCSSESFAMHSYVYRFFSSFEDAENFIKSRYTITNHRADIMDDLSREKGSFWYWSVERNGIKGNFYLRKMIPDQWCFDGLLNQKQRDDLSSFLME